MNRFVSVLTLFAPLLLVVPAVGADLILLCGGDEVFAVNPETLASGRVEKLWSWRASDQKSLPEELVQAFRTTDDCKPIHEGRQILITSSAGGYAMVDYASGEVSWFARVTNAHSIELLPGNRVVVASSTGTNGNRLELFDLSRSMDAIGSTPLVSAHGVVWDADRESLWALGYDELRRYSLEAWDSKSPTLKVEQTFKLPDAGGHDLQAVPATSDLLVTTHETVSLFDRDQNKFRPHPELKGRAHVKAVSIHRASGKTFFVQALDPKRWWSDSVGSLTPPVALPVEGERLYKVRWLPAAKP